MATYELYDSNDEGADGDASQVENDRLSHEANDWEAGHAAATARALV